MEFQEFSQNSVRLCSRHILHPSRSATMNRNCRRTETLRSRRAPKWVSGGGFAGRSGTRLVVVSVYKTLLAGVGILIDRCRPYSLRYTSLNPAWGHQRKRKERSYKQNTLAGRCIEHVSEVTCHPTNTAAQGPAPPDLSSPMDFLDR